MSIYIVAAKRTAFGSFGGSLKGLSATELCVHSTKAAIASANNLDPSLIDNCFVGNVIQSSPDAAYLARHVALKSGCNISTPSLTINRLCGSGFETVALAANSIKLGESSIVIAGGSENMSAAPLQIGGNDARWGVNLGAGLKVEDGKSVAAKITTTTKTFVSDYDTSNHRPVLKGVLPRFEKSVVAITKRPLPCTRHEMHHQMR